MKRQIVAGAILFSMLGVVTGCKKEEYPVSFCEVESSLSVVIGASVSEGKRVKEEEMVPRAVNIDGEIYYDMGEAESGPTCGVADGCIVSSTSKDELPQKNRQSNFGKAEYFYGREEGEIIIRLDKTWISFKKKD